jgi:hypothetical protein
MGGCRVLAIIKILKHHQMATTGGRGVVVLEGLPNNVDDRRWSLSTIDPVEIGQKPPSGYLPTSAAQLLTSARSRPRQHDLGRLSCLRS